MANKTGLFHFQKLVKTRLIKPPTLPTLLYPTVLGHSSPHMSFYYNLPTLLYPTVLSHSSPPLCPSTTISLHFSTQLSLSILLPLCPSTTISLHFSTQLSLSILLPLCPSTTISLHFFTQLSLSILLPHMSFYYNLPTLLYPTVFVHSPPPLSFYYNLPTLLSILSTCVNHPGSVLQKFVILFKFTFLEKLWLVLLLIKRYCYGTCHNALVSIA